MTNNLNLYNTEKNKPAVTKYERIREFLITENEPKFRFQQVVQAVFKQKVAEFEKMTALPIKLRHKLIQQFGSTLLDIRPVSQALSPQAEKVLFEIPGGDKIEAVAMKYRAGWNSYCISSQSGCGFGCSFCATGAIGLKRNLSADEITDQILYFAMQQRSVDSISFMGMGEALANPQTFMALQILTDPELFGFSPRRITVSTIGIIPGIHKLAKQFPQINLTFSLHSPFHEQRSELMPINEKYALADVMDVLDEHIRETGRKVYLAYVLLPGVNDTQDHVRELIALFRKRLSLKQLYHVNLIRYNPALGAQEAYGRPDQATVDFFYQQLRKAGIKVTVRQSFGIEIDAACGQLYGQYEAGKRNKIKRSNKLDGHLEKAGDAGQQHL
ncbi:Cfr family 23S rRNA (adenine(2503)-C(8))-methyltransferase [Paenibacillus sp. J2TS4]|uniref:Cfr family 23S rRNA (adenine(2503)-C(8))-methyltransferase n=1 Tax=Paenibacillus sp. J2TS4 TaxID=2807194 RepID=UPI001B087EA7|nr:23S rRNA (adenine(2503)-C(8))-methyltransferase Cfr [Paenibacillus sp. J2TS4]GIP35005.1 ribosomal RNA large subunit methyltransferase Cfr [Paenibacillus sp. J2TS4]